MKNIVNKIIVGSVAALFGVASFGAALTANTGTPQRSGMQTGLLAASNHIYAGALVSVNSSGKAVPASDAASTKVIGRASKEVDNTGANYSTNSVIPVDRGVFRWVNAGSFTAADIGSLAYVLDDQSVVTAAQATNDIVAGIIIDVDSAGVWVDSFAVGSQGAASVTTLSASGNASIGGTLAVTGAATLSSTLTVGAINGGVSRTNLIYTVAAGTANCITNTLKTINGAVTQFP